MEYNKKPLEGGVGALRQPDAAARYPYQSANLLYKALRTPAASPRAKISRCVRVNCGCTDLRARSGPGAQAGGSPAQTGHDPSK